MLVVRARVSVRRALKPPGVRLLACLLVDLHVCMNASTVEAASPPVSALTTPSGGHGQLYLYLSGRRRLRAPQYRPPEPAGLGGAVILT